MKKKVLLAVAGAVALVVIVLLIVLTAGGASPMSYAPEGTDMIAYFNFKKFYSSKIGKALLAEEKFKRSFAEAEKEMGLTEKELTSTEVYLFADIVKGEEKPQIAVISCTKKGVPQKILDSLKDAAKLTVDGKPAARKDDRLFVVLGKNMLQFSPIAPETPDKDLHALKKGKKTALAKAVDTGALISIAIKIDADTKAQLREASHGGFPDDFDFLTANIREKGKNLIAEVVAEFQKKESAKQTDQMLAGFLEMLKNNAETAEMLKDLKIEAKGKKLVISLKIETDKAVTLLKSMM